MHNVLATWLTRCELNKGTKDHAQIDGEKPQDLNPPQKTAGNWVKLEAG